MNKSVVKMSEKYKNKLTNLGDVNGKYDNILVQMEVTNACNHKCYFCPNKDSKRKKTFIDYSFACRMIDEASEFLGKGKEICFHMNGEPFLYKQLPELIRYSKKKGFEYVFITTNGSLCSKDTLSAVFEAGLDSIKFSINSGEKDNYKTIHGKDDFERVIEALVYSDNYRKTYNKDIRIFVSCVVTKDNYHTIDILKNRVRGYCDELVLYNPCGYAGQNNDLAKQIRCENDAKYKLFDIRHTIPCPVLWNSINITCEGYLSLCCSESDNRLIVEDLNVKSLKEAWQGYKMRRIRDLHKKKEIKKTPCESCVYETNYIEGEMDSELFSLALEKRSKQ